MSSPTNEPDRNLEHFVRMLAKKCYVDEATALKFTNEYWGTEFKHLTLQEMLMQNRSQTSSRASSVASTPRMGPSSNSTLSNLDMDQLSSLVTPTAKRARGGGPNKCTYKLKSGERKNQECGKSCAGEYCATHAKMAAGLPPTVPATSTQTTLTQFAHAQAQAQADAEETPKRKMQKKAPIPLSDIDKYIAAQVQTFQLNRRKNASGQDVLVHLQTGFVYDDVKQAIYGHTDDEGKTIKQLTRDQIEQIKAMNMKYYELPSNLATSAFKTELAVEDPNAADDDDDLHEDISDGE